MPEPKWLTLARAEIGTKEAPGQRDNPTVVQYYVDAARHKQRDSVPWCAAFVGAMLARAGEAPSGSLMARSYLTWGTHIDVPRPGAIVVFARGRPPNGHVAFFDKDNGNGTIRVIGGNQSDKVSYSNYRKNTVVGYRWPKPK